MDKKNLLPGCNEPLRDRENCNGKKYVIPYGVFKILGVILFYKHFTPDGVNFIGCYGCTIMEQA